MSKERTRLDDVNDWLINSLNKYRKETGRKPISKAQEARLQDCNLLRLGLQPSKKTEKK